MGDQPEQQQRTEATSRAASREYGTNQSLLAFWDLSAAPKDNKKRNAKLGSEVQATGICIKEFDTKDLSTRIIDGLSTIKFTSYYVLEPDNWVVRPHEKKGFPDIDNTWDLRLILDHENDNFKRKNRGTMVINQCETQHWGWLSDILQHVLLKPENEDDELFLDAAGFWYRYTDNDPIKFRAPIALNIAKNAGYATDGNKKGTIGQLWTVLHLAVPCDTSTQEASECEPSVVTELVLRGDVAFAVDEKLAELSYCEDETIEEQDGELQVGQFIVREELSSKPPENEHLSDENSNNPELERCEHKGLWACIKIPYGDYTGYAVTGKIQFG